MNIRVFQKRVEIRRRVLAALDDDVAAVVPKSKESRKSANPGVFGRD
jgi:hypothetical protein